MKEDMDKKIGFNDLSGSLKILVMGGWILFALFGLAFIQGFFGY